MVFLLVSLKALIGMTAMTLSVPCNGSVSPEATLQLSPAEREYVNAVATLKNVLLALFTYTKQLHLTLTFLLR